MAGEMPERALRFHSAVDRLQTSIQKEASRSILSALYLFDVTPRLAQQVEQLRGIAEGLRRMIESAEQLDKDVLDISKMIGADDRTMSALHAWIDRRVKPWRGDLARVGMAVDNAAELDREHDALRMQEKQIRNTKEVISHFADALEILPKLPNAADRAHLQGEIAGWREAIVAGDVPIRETIREEIVKRVLPLRDMLRHQQTQRRPESTPGADGGDLENHVHLTRLWLGKLDSERGKISGTDQNIEDLRAQLKRELDLAHAQRSSEKARQVASDARDLARRICDSRLHELETRLRHLRPVLTGEQPELAKAVAELKKLPIERHVHFPEWIEKSSTVSNLVKAQAKNSHAAMSEALRSRIAAAEKRIARLADHPLAGNSAAILARDAGKIAKEGTVDILFEAFSALESLERAMEDAELRAQEQLLALKKEREQLRTRAVQLSSSFSEAAVEMPQPQIDLWLSTVPEDRPTRELLAALEAQLSSAEAKLVELCKIAAVQLQKEAEAIEQALADQGLSAPPAPAPGRAENQIAALGRVRQRHGAAKSTLFAAIAKLREKAAQQVDELSALPADWLRLEDREYIAHLLRSLGATENDSGEPSIDQLTSINYRLDEAETFITALTQEHREVESLHQDLLGHLKQLTDEGLVRYYPGKIARIRALVYGVDVGTWRRTGANRQLREAAHLLQLIDEHARRLAAADLEKAIETLSAHARSAPSATACLEQLQRLDPYQPVPQILRMQILTAAHRLGAHPRG